MSELYKQALFMVLVVFLNKSASFTINTSGFEHCVVHIIDLDFGASRENTDLVEKISSSSGLGQRTTTNNESKLAHEGRGYKNELCSVNIIIGTQGCVQGGTLLKIRYASRISDIRNSFIIIQQLVCTYYLDIFDKKPRPVDAEIFMFFLNFTEEASKNVSRLALTIYLCSPCTTEFRVTPLDEGENIDHDFSLADMRSKAVEIRAISRQPVIVSMESNYFPHVDVNYRLCSHLYRPTTVSLGCSPGSVLGETIAAKLNFSSTSTPALTPKLIFKVVLQNLNS